MAATVAAMTPPTTENPATDPTVMRTRFEAVRAFSGYLCEPLEIEDYGLQSMPDASPAKWHLAHTTWFFETFVLGKHAAPYTPVHPQFAYLFNSYYNAAGPQFLRPHRGFLSRPTVAEVYTYRAQVDEELRGLLARSEDPDLLTLVELGLHHEQQHQELLLTDLKHGLSMNPLHPVYRPRMARNATCGAIKWGHFAEGLYEIGHDAPAFCYDNETPRHRVFLHPFSMADRLVTNGEYMAFMEDGGYERPEHWLSEGHAVAKAEGWKAPLYWYFMDGQWQHFTLGGLRPVEPDEPVCHVSHFEADAYAHWAGCRLPTEFEWEVAAADAGGTGHFVEDGFFHPVGVDADAPEGALQQMFGEVWEWTRSAYLPYPGYRAAPGALGEYNGKFMSNQMVLRGGSCATSASHIRASYRNFFPSAARWQFSGIRLAKDQEG